MLVTNNTTHCFVLAAGVIIEPSAVDVAVSDTSYATDSTLNSQIDALDDGGFITITGKPALDPFPTGNVIATPALLIGTDPSTTPLTVTAAEGQWEDGHDLFVVKAEAGDGQGGFTILRLDPYSEMVLRGLPGGNSPFLKLDEVGGDHLSISLHGSELVSNVSAASPLHVQSIVPGATAPTLLVTGVLAQTGSLLEVWSNSALVFAVHADGTVHAKTGGSIHFDL